MALTRDFKETVVQRAQHDHYFAQALVDEAATLILNGEHETAQLILLDLVYTTKDFERHATLSTKPINSLQCSDTDGHVKRDMH
ncbi:MAG: hypothetical protein KJ852_16585 [Gammaproteobacteria bacterium]|nr:hypothetical protein [Gammaproteobacteria bacterium]MBU0786840.1 hypothetical protein [Gammaproteobacteria bacterium]MBU0813954.1 hypothetical protein [Gammaproteobacteria bacterium]MBU1788573.1 hypothetical protein [Gammaproteobacteria bacterium]